jgi:hypothetical protein
MKVLHLELEGRGQTKSLIHRVFECLVPYPSLPWPQDWRIEREAEGRDLIRCFAGDLEGVVLDLHWQPKWKSQKRLEYPEIRRSNPTFSPCTGMWGACMWSQPYGWRIERVAQING